MRRMEERYREEREEKKRDVKHVFPKQTPSVGVLGSVGAV